MPAFGLTQLIVGVLFLTLTIGVVTVMILVARGSGSVDALRIPGLEPLRCLRHAISLKRQHPRSAIGGIGRPAPRLAHARSPCAALRERIVPRLVGTDGYRTTHTPLHGSAPRGEKWRLKCVGGLLPRTGTRPGPGR